MTSTDREILLSINNQLAKITVSSDTDREFQTEVLTRLDNLEHTQAIILQDTAAIKQEQAMLRHDIDTLQTSVYWVLAAIGIFLAAIAVLPSIFNLATMSSRKPEQHEDGVRLTLSQLGTLLTNKLIEDKK